MCSGQGIGAHVVKFVEIAKNAGIEVCGEAFADCNFIREGPAETAKDANGRRADLASFAASARIGVSTLTQ